MPRPTQREDDVVPEDAPFDAREPIASGDALKAFFEPASVAVVGASRDRGSIGGAIFQNLLRYGFEGPVYPGQSST